MAQGIMFSLVLQVGLAAFVEELRALIRQREDEFIALLLGFLLKRITPADTFR